MLVHMHMLRQTYQHIFLVLNTVCFALSQLIEVTGKTQDECMVALHDCNEDVNRAINFLLESTSDTVSLYTHTKRLFLYTYWTSVHTSYGSSELLQRPKRHELCNILITHRCILVKPVLWLTFHRTPGRLWGRSGALGKKEDPQR